MPATGAVNFKLSTAIFNAQVFPEVQARMADLAPFFALVIDEWALGNKGKFQRSMGKEESGVRFSPEPAWEPLTDGYIKSKARLGFPSWLMVRTGQLATALTTEGMFFRMVEPQSAIFGTPNDPEEADKVRFNWEKRQAVFLDADDMKTISMFWNDYVTMGPKFREIKLSAALENKRMKAEFAFIVGEAEA